MAILQGISLHEQVVDRRKEKYNVVYKHKIITEVDPPTIIEGPM